MSGKGVKRKQQPKSPMRKRRSLDGPMDRMLKKITNGSEGGLLHYNHGNRANLCGQVDIESICQIIREWVSTEEGAVNYSTCPRTFRNLLCLNLFYDLDLMDEDIAYINKFFLDLVDEQDFERLQIALDVYFE